jgi:hypothetical protein
MVETVSDEPGNRHWVVLPSKQMQIAEGCGMQGLTLLYSVKTKLSKADAQGCGMQQCGLGSHIIVQCGDEIEQK